MPRLRLENNPKALPLAFVPIRRIHSISDMLSQPFARRLIEPPFFIERDLEFSIDEPQASTINNRLAELFDQIQFKRGLAWPIGVDKPGIGIKSCQD